MSNKPYPDCVGHVRGVWVRAYRSPEATGVALGTELYTRDEALELARLLVLAAAELGPKTGTE